MRITALLMLIMASFVAACEKQTTYPVSGEACGPDDPVQTLDAADCLPPVGN